MTTRDFLYPKTSGVGGYDLPVLPEWLDGAACASVGSDMFFPGKHEETTTTTKDAKKVCRGCEVLSECLEWALAGDERWGVWGGTTEADRRKIRRERRAS